MLVLNANDVDKALPMVDAVAAMKEALVSLAEGTANLPQRTHLDVEAHQGTTLIMPAHVNGEGTESLTVKVVSVFGNNPDRGMPRIQAAVIVLEPTSGKPFALLEGSRLTGIRTAATSGAATDALARDDSKSLAILGAGVQARTHLAAMVAVRPIERVTIWSRRREAVEQLIDEAKTVYGDCQFQIADIANEAVAEADVVCTVTTADQPLFDHRFIRPGTHLNVVGSYQPQVREVPTETVLSARLFVEEIESALEEAGDIIQPIDEGRMGSDHILGTIGEVLTGTRIGRDDANQITLYKSVGNAAEDALAAAVTLTNAKRLGLGVEVDF